MVGLRSSLCHVGEDSEEQDLHSGKKSRTIAERLKRFVYVPTDNPQARYKYGEDVCISATGLCDYSMSLKTFTWALLHRCVLWYIVADVLLDYTLLLFRDGPFRDSYASTSAYFTTRHKLEGELTPMT